MVRRGRRQNKVAEERLIEEERNSLGNEERATVSNVNKNGKDQKQKKRKHETTKSSERFTENEEQRTPKGKRKKSVTVQEEPEPMETSFVEEGQMVQMAVTADEELCYASEIDDSIENDDDNDGIVQSRAVESENDFEDGQVEEDSQDEWQIDFEKERRRKWTNEIENERQKIRKIDLEM